MELVVEVYTLTRKLPEHERFGLVSQMQRDMAENTLKS